ncbi:bifunctional adenosylcobinamide kinase/adenosylcobinamide-phosphate guanylyltransferase [Cohnella sp. CFH 77786]|uniref:bifunctional adenosylcobinamide kinase/adenosylcobinamide-phosphate guanylyltransferase n=1 Tax=Cohnella sp. CFH 77786 TaxID=2662265 RepID=UPI001C60D59C|nr:bifunctional adenosylcobinamide kinase/adenosylcobinamide-phosphate guanylyltransferase [Cohnella sp. CFH 77786]MBW5448017.1 bifunctional adenosylcobinamide kinase/adenosylcobinamide-phosphate guanylyltransferase [Cohnella sp. CFH 77786]
MIVLVTGGARSGKSRFAERYAAHLGRSGLYVATSQVHDEEMRARVDRHRERRERSEFAWETVEEPYDLCGVLKASSHPVVLVDCLTLWLSNWLLYDERGEDPESRIWSKIEELEQTLSGHGSTVIMVTNEVGDGIVPEYPLGRQFRDLAGWMNQRVAEVSEQVFRVTAGIPIELKSRAYRLPDGNGRAR